MVTYFKWFAIAAVTASSCLLEFVKRGLVQWWLSNRKNLMLSSVDSVLKLLTPQSVKGCFTIVIDEMKESVDPDEEVCCKTIHGLQSVVSSLRFMLIKYLDLITSEAWRAGKMTECNACGIFAT